MWLLVNLSKEYRSSIEVIIKYKNPPVGKILFKDGGDTINAEISTSGLGFIRNRLDVPEIDIDLDKVLLTNYKNDFWLPNRSLDILRERLNVKEVYRVKNDTISLIINKLGKKLVPIKSMIKVNTGQGFKIKKINKSIDSVLIRGPLNYVQTISSINTDTTTFKEVDEDFNAKVKLIYPFKIEGEKFIDYDIEVEKYTEKIFDVKIQPLQAPANSKVQIIPSMTKLKVNVGYSEFSSINVDDFQVVCDLSQINNSVSNLILKVNKKPANIEAITLNPSRVKILLLKNE